MNIHNAEMDPFLDLKRITVSGWNNVRVGLGLSCRRIRAIRVCVCTATSSEMGSVLQYPGHGVSGSLCQRILEGSARMVQVIGDK
jgi:hypothetical protein